MSLNYARWGAEQDQLVAISAEAEARVLRLEAELREARESAWVAVCKVREHIKEIPGAGV